MAACCSFASSNEPGGAILDQADTVVDVDDPPRHEVFRTFGVQRKTSTPNRA